MARRSAHHWHPRHLRLEHPCKLVKERHMHAESQGGLRLLEWTGSLVPQGVLVKGVPHPLITASACNERTRPEEVSSAIGPGVVSSAHSSRNTKGQVKIAENL